MTANEFVRNMSEYGFTVKVDPSTDSVRGVYISKPGSKSGFAVFDRDMDNITDEEFFNFYTKLYELHAQDLI